MGVCPSGAPDTRSKLKLAGFRQCSVKGPLSEALMRVESSSFIKDVFATPHSEMLNTTFFVVTRTTSTHISRWTALLLHSTNQFFIKAPPLTDSFEETLVMMLDLAEELRATDAFLCVPVGATDCEDIVSELLRLDFTLVSPCKGVSSEFEVLRFQF